MKQNGDGPYRLAARTSRKRGGDSLSGYAIDVTVRINKDGAYFLDDHNSVRSAMPHNDRAECLETLTSEITRLHADHFGAT
jgi:predicted pyridoxine 5'-phosphate oxidase superfamily flavin-nucleotide-binding protein